MEEVLSNFGGMNGDCGEWVVCLCGGPVACFCRRIQRTEVAAKYMFSPQGAFCYAAQKSWHKEPALDLQMPRPVCAQAPGNTKGAPHTDFAALIRRTVGSSDRNGWVALVLHQLSKVEV